MDVFGDFGFAGAYDTTSTPYQDRQECINWFPEIAASKKAKVAVSLLGAPGLNQLVAAPSGGAPGFSSSMVAWPSVSAVTTLPVRGLWTLSGSTQALAVIRNICYLVTQIPSGIALQDVGTLATNTGPVCIRDDGLGNYAVIVDGPNGYIYSIAAKSLTTITDPAWLGSNTVAFIDGWWIFQQPGTQTFYTNAQPYAITFDATYFANKDAYSDKLMAVFESKEELWLIGEETTEIWYDAGGQYFPFARLVGTLIQWGTKSAASVARISVEGQDGLIWWGRNDRGENAIVLTKGFQAFVVSTPAVSAAISAYNVTSDAIGYTYQDGGHQFYVLTFPTADKTWVFDSTVPIEFAWTQRSSYDPYQKAQHRHRSNCYMNFAGMRIVGDYQNGALYQMSRQFYTDAGWPIYRRRRAPYIWDGNERQRVFMSSLQIEFAPGQGTSSGLGSAPVANLRISRDGTTFGQQWPLPMGSIGQFKQRTMIRRLAFGRNNLVEVEVIQPCNADIVGATLKAMSESGAQG